ncbi:MAG TPA: hypothetical protein VGF95_15250 [Solirubrobacteraceae bacterium]
MKVCRSLLALILAVVGLSVLAGGAWGAVTAAPAWEVAAAVGPTHLSPRQSEVQRVMVGAEGGTFTLLQKAQAEAVPKVRKGVLSLENANTEATIVSGEYRQGDPVKGTGIRIGTTIASCPSGCSTPGTKVTLSTTASKTASSETTVSTKELEVTSVTGTFAVGAPVVGVYLSAGTVVTAPVSNGILTVSTYPLVAAKMTITSEAVTTPIAYDASTEEVQSAIEALAGFGAGSVAVIGGPGGDAEHPYLLTFVGPLAERAVQQFTADGESLTGTKRYATVSTMVPGGPGTGEIGIYPTNVGGVASSGEVTVKLGPLPEGVVTSGPANATGWNCVTEEREATCRSANPVLALEISLPAIKVPVEVRGTSGADLESVVTISGGGASGSSSYRFPIVVSATPASPGVAAFWTGAFEADGQPSVQAGGHPYSELTWFLVNTDRSGAGEIVPAGDVKNVEVALPPGFLGDPMVTERCPEGFKTGCTTESVEIGRLRASSEFAKNAIFPVAVENDVPVGGAAAEFTAIYAAPYVSLLGSVRSSEDFGVTVDALHVPSTFQKSFMTYTALYGFPQAANGKAFFRNSTDCGEQARQAPAIGLETDSWEQPGAFDAQTQPLSPITGCEALEFKAYDPQTSEGQVSFSLQPTSTVGSSGVGATAHLHIDQSGLTDPEKLGTPDLKESVVTLPEGLDVNPGQANGLEACSEAEVGYEGEGALPNPTRFNDDPVSCPDASKLGTVEVSTPLLEEPLQGTIYLAAQEENPFHSLIALYLVIESKRFGVTLKLPGKVEVNEGSGQITATFDYVPQQPVEDLTLHFRGGGGRSEFATPEVCGTYTTKGNWTPWSAPESGPPAETSDSFNVASGCSSSPATRPFNPGFEASMATPAAGAFSPLTIKLSRNDGEQELTHLNVTLPKGLIGSVMGVAECSEAQIMEAEGKSGRAELAQPSCPLGSEIGRVDAAAGVGSEPVHVPGRVYFAGPYEGAPFSTVVVTPAVAGPFDLGDVVVRAPLYIDPKTAQVSIKSDPIPTILQGIPLKLRSVTIEIDRSAFTLNPTSCEPMSVSATITGASGATATPSSRFQVGGCPNLKFTPKFTASTQAKVSRRDGASLKVMISQKAGEADLHRVDVQLPKLLPSRIETLKLACTEQQFNANPAACPAESKVGTAIVHTPVLSVPLQGPAILVSHGGAAFPDLVLVLQADERGGVVTIVAEGDTEIKNGITYSRFETIPDAPISSMELNLPEGRYSILGAPSANGDLCGRSLVMPTTIEGQNGAVVEKRVQIEPEGCSGPLSVRSHRVEKGTLVLRVYAPSAGKLTVSGKGVEAQTESPGAPKIVTFKIHERKVGRLKTRVSVLFTPSKGEARKRQVKRLAVKFKAPKGQA